MIDIREFENWSGGIKRVSLGTFTATGIFHPAEEMFYKDEIVVYQLCEGIDRPFILVPGYRKSGIYEKDKGLAVKVKPVNNHERKAVAETIKKIAGYQYGIQFWD